MKYTNGLVKEIIEYCGGDINKLDEFITNESNKEIKTLADLEKCNTLKNYSSVIDSKEYPITYKYLIDYVRWSKHDTVYLDTIIANIQDNWLWEDGGYIDKDRLVQELIDLKFGSMCYDW